MVHIPTGNTKSNYCDTQTGDSARVDIVPVWSMC